MFSSSQIVNFANISQEDFVYKSGFYFFDRRILLEKMLYKCCGLDYKTNNNDSHAKCNVEEKHNKFSALTSQVRTRGVPISP